MYAKIRAPKDSVDFAIHTVTSEHRQALRSCSADACSGYMLNALGLPNSAFRYLRSHGALDIQHMVFFADLMNRIEDPQSQSQVTHCAIMLYQLYGNVFRELDGSQAKNYQLEIAR